MQLALSLKLFVIFFLILLLLIPLGLIDSKISERNGFRHQARDSVAQSWTGAQRLITPILVLPYEEIHKVRSQNGFEQSYVEKRVKGYRMVAPVRLQVSGKLDSEVLRRGIYEVPVYHSTLQFSGLFSQERIETALSEIRSALQPRELGSPFLMLQVSDPRGIKNLPQLAWGGQTMVFRAGTQFDALENGIHIPLMGYLESEFDAGLEDESESHPEQQSENWRLARLAAKPFNFELDLRGMENLSFVPLGEQVKIQLNSSWPHPQFIGAFLPDRRKISADGFSAEWSVTEISSNVDDKLHSCQRGLCEALGKISFGVNLIEPVDIYLQSERSIKYAILFIGLSFVSFFLFENLRKIRIHPIQYGLVGLSIAVFYLLLVSLSEHIDFGMSYLIATLACIGLMFSYLKYVLGGIRGALGFAAGLAALYAVLYVIVQAEDFALLMGAVLVFILLAAVMLITRKVDWYEIGGQVVERSRRGARVSEPPA